MMKKGLICFVSIALLMGFNVSFAGEAEAKSEISSKGDSQVSPVDKLNVSIGLQYRRQDSPI